ncbi:MAG: UvrD-helicase domain-containing protein [Desulfobacterales bacterium]|nr:UvrD-helicase domain-containing protein [Desulfobacterales bacterium]MDD4071112.1 UvrD-helicase domain-containing protein [Desulfobacterales bacterium]MDD4393545.1 UvrD-helicase domain-containing protein [Desulfobacterales bacterium]
MELSSQQKEAVEYTGTPALVVAGAGSGKTRTLISKMVYLVEGGFDPQRILAITFTNKAADEMKDRLIDATGLTLQQFPWVRTFHSACYRILKLHCEKVGLHAPLQIYSEYHQKKTIKDIIVDRFNLDKKHVPVIAAQISNAKNSGDPEAYFQHNSRSAQMRLLDIYRIYEEELQNKNAVDFDDILMLVRNLLRDNPDIRRSYQEKFQYILCDEYQDTNDLQEEIARLLMKNGNLFCVGDDWQAIYSFRGSNVNNFLEFQKKYKGSKVFRLEQNYRCANEIVQVANDLIKYNDQQMNKSCFSSKQGGIVECLEFGDERAEADWVAQKIKVLLGHGIPYQDMAVLFRTKFCSLSFEQSFRYFQIPYRMLGGKGFFERKEIMDLNCYLMAAVFESDDAAFERIVNTPKRGIGAGAISKIAKMKTMGMSLQDAARKALAEKILAPRIYQPVSRLIELLDDIKMMKPDAAVQEVLDRVGYLDHLKSYSISNSMDYTSKVENIEQLMYSAGQKDSIADYLEEAALVREDKKDEDDESGFGVNLSTVHASKGLEFKVVFVVGCEEQLFPHWKAMDSEAGLEEERRLMYVAMTRAEKCLFLSSANYRKGQFNRRSRFLDEIYSSLDR